MICDRVSAHCLTVAAQAAEAADDEGLVAEVRCRNVSLLREMVWVMMKGGWMILLLPSCSSCQEPSKQKSCF